uniref:Uncharacterized protein n=1 Tax=Timema tahoe TaxID=61484 RepID=A0A7R9IEC6_9NEOP|nr:unnamed protein product [Timema tahoe]
MNKTSPVPIVDNIKEEDKYGNTGAKFNRIGRGFVDGVSAITSFFSTAADYPVTVLKGISRKVTEQLNNDAQCDAEAVVAWVSSAPTFGTAEDETAHPGPPLVMWSAIIKAKVTKNDNTCTCMKATTRPTIPTMCNLSTNHICTCSAQPLVYHIQIGYVPIHTCDVAELDITARVRYKPLPLPGGDIVPVLVPGHSAAMKLDNKHGSGVAQHRGPPHLLVNVCPDGVQAVGLGGVVVEFDTRLELLSQHVTQVLAEHEGEGGD